MNKVTRGESVRNRGGNVKEKALGSNLWGKEWEEKTTKLWETESEAQGKSGDEGPGGPIEKRISIMSNALKSWGGKPRLRKAIGCSNVEHRNGFQENYSAEEIEVKVITAKNRCVLQWGEAWGMNMWSLLSLSSFITLFPRDGSQSHCCQLELFTHPVSHHVLKYLGFFL